MRNQGCLPSINTSDDNYKPHVAVRMCKYCDFRRRFRVLSVIPGIRILSLNFTEENNADVILVVRTGYIATHQVYGYPPGIWLPTRYMAERQKTFETIKTKPDINLSNNENKTENLK